MVVLKANRRRLSHLAGLLVPGGALVRLGALGAPARREGAALRRRLARHAVEWPLCPAGLAGRHSHPEQSPCPE